MTAADRTADAPARAAWLPQGAVPRVVFVALVALFVAANVVVIAESLTRARLWEDEAFNLTVPLNLLAGLGYTSDGTLSGSVLTPFDVRISTGPVVLLPVAAVLGLGADPVIGGRLVALVFWAALVAGLWIVGRGVAGPWGGLVAASVPLALHLDQPPSPVQGPADILGEIPAAALVVWAVIAARSRPWLGGLLLGLAIQAKFIALLAVPALTVLVFFAVAEQRFGARVRRVLPAAATALAPTVAFEVWKIIALDPAEYAAATRRLAHFIVSGGQEGVRTDAAAKVAVLADAWFVLWPIAVIVAVIAVAGACLALVHVRRGAVDPLVQRDRLWPARDIALITATSLVGAGTYVAWWLVSSHTPVWIRHPSPGLLAFAPLVAAVALLGWRATLRGRGRPVRATAVVGIAAVAAGIAASVGLHAAMALAAPDALSAQRATAAAIADVPEVEQSDWLAVQWGTGVSIGLLTGRHIGLLDAGASVETYPWMWTGEPREPCDELARVDAHVVCAPPRAAD